MQPKSEITHFWLDSDPSLHTVQIDDKFERWRETTPQVRVAFFKINYFRN
jgi:hypothetical protein